MATKQTTYRQVNEFISAADAYLRANPEASKLEYALKKMLKRCAAIMEDYNEKLEDLRIENCIEDEKGVIARDERGNYQFSKSGLKTLLKAHRTLADQAVSLEDYIATALPENLSGVDRENFAGFVVPGE